MTLRLGGDGAITGCTSLENPDLTVSGLTISGSFDAEKVLVSSGTAAAPSYTFSGDTDNGLYYAGTNSIGLSTAGTNAILIDSSGRVGVGTSSPGQLIQIGEGDTGVNANVHTIARIEGRAVAAGQQVGTLEFNQITNAPAEFVGASIGIESSAATRSESELVFKVSQASNTNATEAMRLDSSGRVGIGTTSPAEPLHIANTVPVIRFEDTNNSNALLDISGSAGDCRIDIDPTGLFASSRFSIDIDGSERLRIDSSGRLLVGTTSSIGGEIQCINGSGAQLSLARNDSGSTVSGNSIGQIRFYGNHGGTYSDIGRLICSAAANHSSTSKPTDLRFYTTSSGTTSTTERMRLDSSGRLLVGTSSSRDTRAYIQSYRVSGENHHWIESEDLANGEYCIYRARANNSGGGSRSAYLGVYKNVSTTNTVPFIFLDAEDGDNNYYWVDNVRNFRTSSSTSNLGTTGGTVVGTQTSDRRLKNIKDTFSYGLAEVLQLNPREYALIKQPDTNKLGFVAQEVESIIPEAVFDTLEEFDGHQEGDRTRLGMEYVQLIPVLVNAIKELSAEVNTLKTKVATLEAS